MIKILTCLLFLTIVGCATPKMYNPTNISTQDLSNVRTSSSSGLFLSDEFSAWILYIYDVNNKELTNRDPLSTQINEIYLPAGVYRFRVSCKNKRYKGSPVATFKLEASKNYEITCEVTKDSNLSGISVDSKVQLKISQTG